MPVQLIFNPAYQGEADNNGRKPPVYHLFLEEAYKIADTVEMITPARFLFSGGQTPKAWNEKMLSDKHLKVLYYEHDSAKVFSNTEIKGGVTITIRDAKKDFGAIEFFSPDEAINGLVRNVIAHYQNGEQSFSSIVSPQGMYKFSDKVFEEHPEVLTVTGEGTKSKIISRIVDMLPEVFLKNKPDEEPVYEILARVNNAREYRYILKKYIQDNDYIHSFNLILPKASGAGIYGEALGSSTLSKPEALTTDTFVSIGQCSTENEAENINKYTKTKFFRALLGTIKVNQDVSPDKFKFVPLQDFSKKSDIDWSKSIKKIDRELYKKYNLSVEEIDFIEKNVKEME